MRRGVDRIPGYQEDIHPGVWHRHDDVGAPQKWTYAWIAICGYGMAYILYALSLPLLIPWRSCGALGQGAGLTHQVRCAVG